MASKFIKKPVVVEAMQYFGGESSASEIIDEIYYCGRCESGTERNPKSVAAK